MVAGLASAGVNVVRLGVVPTPGVAYLTGAPRRRPRRDAVGEPQPDAGQRHQVLRPRRHQARRRPRGRDRGADGRGLGPAHRRRRRPGQRRRRRWSRPTSRTSWTASAGRSACDGLKVVVDCANGAAYQAGPAALRGAGRRGRSGSTPRPTASTSTTTAARPTWTPCGRRSRARRRHRHRARRRRRPLPGRRCGRGDRRRRPDPRDPGGVAAGRRAAEERHRRGHGDEQPRLRQRDATAPGSPSSRPGSVTATCWRR